MNAIFLVPDLPGASGHVCHGNDSCCRCGDGHNDLEDEEPFQLVRRNEENGKLDAEKEEVGQ